MREERPGAAIAYSVCVSLASHTLTHERGSAIVELCNLDGFDDVVRSGDCDQLIVRLYTRYRRVLTHA